MRRGLPRWTLLAAVIVGGASLAFVRRGGERAPTGADTSRSVARPPAAGGPLPDTSGGLRCIRAGATREEVRRAMGEPDSVAFGDWLYGASSVTFGYGTVLDFSNAGGNLVLCP